MTRAVLLTMFVIAGCSGPKPSCPSETLCSATQPPWTNALPIPGRYVAGSNPSFPGADYYEVHVTQFQQWFGLRSPETGEPLYTTVWGYGQVGHTYDTGVRDALGNPKLQSGSYIAPSFVATRGKDAVVKWIDDRKEPDGRPMTAHLLESAYDATLDGTASDEPHVRMIVHLHGAEVAPASDGFPEHWFTPDPSALANGQGGPPGNFVVDTYPNRQQPATLWYHDHAMGIVRLNIMATGAGFYLLRDPTQEAALDLPTGRYEIPLVIADRMFDADGQLSYLNAANAPGTPYHPQLSPEFFGDVITVNGMAWPYLEVEPRKYRFTILNASNARMYNLQLVDLTHKQPWPNVWQVGTDGGYLTAPVQLAMTPVGDDATDTSTKLLLAPAERADVVIDFAQLPPGTVLAFTNDAAAPFPDGDAPDPASTGQVLQFRVVAPAASDDSKLPERLNPRSTRLDAGAASVTRHLVLTEIEDPVTGNPVAGLINNTCFDQPISESPRVGSTEIWEIVNATGDTHPIHVHLVQFNLLDRQLFDKERYLADWNAASGNGNLPAPAPTCASSLVDPVDPPGVVSTPQKIPIVGPYLQGEPITPADNEAGWKDTVRVKSGTVTRFLIHFAPQDPAGGPFGGFVFDPTAAPYVYHCHILEHEDNNMMRPYRLTN